MPPAVKRQRKPYVFPKLWVYDNYFDPAGAVQRAMKDQLDPHKRPAPVKSLKDFTEEEIAALEATYGCPVKR